MTHLAPRKLVFLLVLLLVSTSVAAQQLPPIAMPIALYGETLRNASSELFGRGVVLDGASPKVHALSAVRDDARSVLACGAPAEIVWREVRRETDPQGGTHVYYRQHVVGAQLDAELVGSEIAVHRMPDGKLLGIAGQQFESVTVGGCPSYSAAKAAESAHDRIMIYTGQLAQYSEPWTMDAARAARLAETVLKFVQVDGIFRPAYFTYAEDDSGMVYELTLDAQNERLLAIHKANPHDNCAPTLPLQLVTAVGVPVRPDVTNWRTMKANVATRNAGYTHEGLHIPTGGSIRHLVYQKVESTNTNFRCASGKSYTLFPLKVNPALSCCYPVYDEVHIPGQTHFYGHAAGDALWHTYRTIWVFQSLGRNGWDNLNGDARIVVQAGNADQGQFNRVASSAAPAESVMVGPSGNMYSLAASLDLVAHEWGHGVIIKTANFDRTTDFGQQLHEGFADVIGMLVEKRVQGPGNGVEQSSDWVMHEDAAADPVNNPAHSYARGALDDDADGISGHDWVGPNGSHHFDDRLHRYDGVVDPLNPHSTGNLLNVAHRIMAAGGSTTLPSGLNPICARLPGLAGCEAANVMAGNEYLGTSKAGSLLFYAIQFTLLSNTTWEQVADRVNLAAFQRFNLCSAGPMYNAWQEQRAVKKAFAGIGYPRTQPDIQCP